MSAYSAAHGNESAVELVVANDRSASEATKKLITENCKFVNGQWQGIPAAAWLYRQYLESSSLRNAYELNGVDLATVDYQALVRSELQEFNLDAGRSQHDGL